MYRLRLNDISLYRTMQDYTGVHWTTIQGNTGLCVTISYMIIDCSIGLYRIIHENIEPYREKQNFQGL